MTYWIIGGVAIYFIVLTVMYIRMCQAFSKMDALSPPEPLTEDELRRRRQDTELAAITCCLTTVI